MVWQRFVICAAILIVAPLTVWGSEPGSGQYAADRANPEQMFAVDISAKGTATVIHDGTRYADLLTSDSFFGKATPLDFQIAGIAVENQRLIRTTKPKRFRLAGLSLQTGPVFGGQITATKHKTKTATA